MQSRLLGALMIGATLSAVAVGCQRKAGPPENAVRHFIQAARQDDNGALLGAVSQGSKRIVEMGNARGHSGVFYFVRCGGPLDEHAQYELVVVRNTGAVAQVNVRPGPNPPKELCDPRLPRRLKEEGIAIVAVNEGGVWKVDLMETSSLLAAAVLDSSGRLPAAPPPWWPGMPGMPPPPGG